MGKCFKKSTRDGPRNPDAECQCAPRTYSADQRCARAERHGVRALQRHTNGHVQRAPHPNPLHASDGLQKQSQ
ncbi:hypothetical protein CCHR01_11187 [Colletotrichum chrysophilum]|uniref:Uncharacterized protein n=1 Tax=Colletotrichum chrysophilum TaxID=1836956 RepID=A0AAD9AF49_9PEZI|nr:hypothetical protein K456DRAFT_48296 [Colletotrichum gloeosporioides 23]KAK1846185.1 hypothetical protein CCHR01_11187 [Colletotrichum chrysophilum]